MKEGRRVTGLGLEGSFFDDVNFQPGTLRNPGILNSNLVVSVVKKVYLSRWEKNYFIQLFVAYLIVF